MDNIKVGRYTDNEYGQCGHPYAGWVEPEDRTWIVFVRNDHTVEAYLDRDPETGSILEPAVS